MELRIHAHACASVLAEGVRLVVDPWLLGPVYWGAWWHCPDPAFDEEIFRADYVYITHWHFDHLHEESLARFEKSATLLVPKFPVSWMPETLARIGFERIVELEHARPFELAPGFRITSYQIHFQDDSVCAVEAHGTTVLDVNDAKPLPRTWRRILREHPRIDFMLRSHSPAWSYPFSFSFEDPAEAIPIDASSYVRAFCGTADLVRPRFAVPFASSVCHLHPEVVADNASLVTAAQLRSHVERHPLAGSELVVMPHGSRWTSDAGFELTDEIPPEAYVERALVEHAAELARREREESGASLSFAEFERFFRDLLRQVRWLRLFLGIRLVFQPQGSRRHWVVDFRSGRIEDREHCPDRYTSLIRVHPAVLGDALASHTFTNIDISKRWKVHVGRGGVGRHLVMWVVVSLYEAGWFRPGVMRSRRFLAAWWARRAEVLDYLAFAARVALRGKQAAADSVTDVAGAR